MEYFKGRVQFVSKFVKFISDPFLWRGNSLKHLYVRNTDF